MRALRTVPKPLYDGRIWIEDTRVDLGRTDCQEAEAGDLNETRGDSLLAIDLSSAPRSRGAAGIGRSRIKAERRMGMLTR